MRLLLDLICNLSDTKSVGCVPMFTLETVVLEDVQEVCKVQLAMISAR